MSYVGVFLLGSGLGALFMAFMSGVSRNNACKDCEAKRMIKEWAERI